MRFACELAQPCRRCPEQEKSRVPFPRPGTSRKPSMISYGFSMGECRSGYQAITHRSLVPEIPQHRPMDPSREARGKGIDKISEPQGPSRIPRSTTLHSQSYIHQSSLAPPLLAACASHLRRLQTPRLFLSRSSFTFLVVFFHPYVIPLFHLLPHAFLASQCL